MNNVINLINSLNLNDDYVVVACSGGPDSMFLLDTLKNLNLNVICAHVNHNLRKESIDEYKFVQDYCNDNNIIFEGTELHNLPKTNTEIRAREARYKFFEKVIKKYNAKYLFTAHHGDDLMETILMRIVRGSSLNGYSGFNIITDKETYKIVRPLVYLTKDDINKYLDENNIKYVIDNTNYSDSYTRNRYRNHILPLLKNEDKNVHLKFLKYSTTLKEYDNYIKNIVYDYIDNNYVDNMIDLNNFNKLDKLIQKNVLIEIIRKWYPDNLYLVDDNNINEIFKIISSNKPNITLVLPNNIYVIKEYNKLIFKDKLNDNKEYNYILDNSIDINNYGTIKIVDKSNDKSNYTLRLNSNDIKLPIIVRTIKDSDKMEVKNLNGHKKIKDIFIDSKINKDERNAYPIVTDSDDKILWIPGIKKSKFDVSIENKYDIILRYEQGGKTNE